jgi:hypothetical protein
MVRLDVEHYDTAGVYLRTSSAWMVIKTFDGIQNSVASKDAADTLSALCDATLVASLVARES